MQKLNPPPPPPPPVRKEHKTPLLELVFPFNEKAGRLIYYKFDAKGMHLVRGQWVAMEGWL